MSNEEHKEIMTIEEHMDVFKKQLWNNEKPMEFATQMVQELLLEIQRRRTVMAAALHEIDNMWDSHQELAAKNEDTVGLHNLMESLAGRRMGFYSQYLSENEYKEFILRNTDMETFTRALLAPEDLLGVDEGEEQSDE